MYLNIFKSFFNYVTYNTNLWQIIYLIPKKIESPNLKINIVTIILLKYLCKLIKNIIVIL